MIQDPSLTLALALTTISASQDDLVELYLQIFPSSNLLQALIEREVQTSGQHEVLDLYQSWADLGYLAEHESSLFRSNTFATKILTAYARANGRHYLNQTLRDLLVSLTTASPRFNMDYDPYLETPTEVDQVARKNLRNCVEAFLLTILNSISMVPR